MDSINERPSRRAFELPGQDVSVHQARCLFFGAVHRVNPRVTEELMGEPLALSRLLVPLVEQSLTAVPPPRKVGGEYLTPARDTLLPYWQVIRSAPEQESSKFRRLREVLHRWTDRWRLWPADPDEDWCLAIAADAVARAVTDDASRVDPFRLIRFFTMLLFDEQVQFSFVEEQGWQPTYEEWADAKRRLDDAYKRAKQEYKARIEHTCREEGLEPVRRLRHRQGSHFEWLALYQTRGERWAWIADSYHVTDDAVGKAVREKAEFIGLQLRDPERTSRPS